MMSDLIIWIQTLVHFLTFFCLDVMAERGNFWGPFIILIVVRWEQPHPNGVMLNLSLYCELFAWRNFLFSSEQQISQIFSRYHKRYIFDIDTLSVGGFICNWYAYSCRIWPWPLEFFIVLWIENNKKFQQANATAIRVCCKWIDPNFVSGSFLVCVLPGPICIKEVQTYETKRLTRLSVYVERKNVCKWSLVYLQAGKFLWSFLLTQFFLTFCRVSVFFP